MKSVKIKEKHKKFLKPLIRNVDTARSGVMLANEIHTRAQKELWEVLKEEYPESVGRGVSFNHPEGGEWEILLYGKEKSISELLSEATALEQRIKTLEDELVEKVTKEEETVEEELPHEDLQQAIEVVRTETKTDLPPSEPTKDKDLESPPE